MSKLEIKKECQHSNINAANHLIDFLVDINNAT